MIDFDWLATIIHPYDFILNCLWLYNNAAYGVGPIVDMIT
jgi:hypothetical protein